MHSEKKLFLKKKTPCVIAIFAIFFIIIFCRAQETNSPSQNNMLDNTNLDEDIYVSSSLLNQAYTGNSQTICKTQYYELFHVNGLFYCIFYDKLHNITRIEGPSQKQPQIEMLDNLLIRYTMQAGTGVGTQWGYYYDIEREVFSEVFQNIFDQGDGKVAYADSDRIIVRDIFNKTEYYKEFYEFKNTFSNVVSPFTNVHFVENDTHIEITYLSGSDYRKITELFIL